MKLPAPTEHAEQVALCQWLRLRRIDYFAIPNAARRNPRTAAMLKAEGMRAGVPDLVLIPPAPVDGWKHVAIELKRQKGGRLADTQREMHAIMSAHGWIIIVALGFAHAIEQLTGLGY